MVNVAKYKPAKVEIDGLQLFIDAASQFGLEMRDVIANGTIHRVPDNLTTKRNKTGGWYSLDEAHGVWFGAYGSWNRGESHSFCSHTAETITPQQNLMVKQRQQEALLKADLMKQEAAEKATEAADTYSPANPNHPYLVAKGIKPHKALQNGDELIIPIQDIQGNIKTYQRILPDGQKRLLSGGSKKGHFHQIGELTEILYVCEGFATGASIHEATGGCVFVAIDCNNLASVSTALRSVYSSPIVICADNDQYTAGNPGLTAARAIVSSLSNSSVVYPIFKTLEGEPTDFNDLYQREGEGAVIGQILSTKHTALPLLFADDVTPVCDTSDFVEDILRDNEFSVIYGASNCGKTFFMLDLAMHVALGTTWRNKEVEQGGVIYAALEGGHGTRNRIVAFKEHYQIKENIPLAIIPSAVNFLDANGDMKALVQAVTEAKERLGNVRLIVIDTLARAISGGDENSSMDMGQLIISADKLRAITGAHISFIHHSGKDDLKGARGHSSLRAAVDTEIEISRPDTESPSLIKIVKQREMEMIEDMSFSLKAVKLGTNKRGKDVSSCVVVPAEIVKKKREVTMTAAQEFVYKALVEALIEHGQMKVVYPDSPPVNTVTYDELKDALDNKGYKELMATENKTTAMQIKSATQTARIGLQKLGKINFNGQRLWLQE